MESDASGATCPAGTVIIGTGASTSAQDVEINDLHVSTAVGASVPNKVTVFFDNFDTVEHDGNFATAICAAANSVNNPDALKAAKAGKR